MKEYDQNETLWDIPCLDNIADWSQQRNKVEESEILHTDHFPPRKTKTWNILDNCTGTPRGDCCIIRHIMQKEVNTYCSTLSFNPITSNEQITEEVAIVKKNQEKIQKGQ